MSTSPKPSKGDAKPNRSLPKKEILRRKKDIDSVFERGKSLREPFLKIMFQTATRETGEPLVAAMFAASKRSVKKAAHRNRIKRLLREAYRLNKQPFLEQLRPRLVENEKLCVVFLYQPYRRDDLTLSAATASIQKAFKKILDSAARQQATMNTTTNDTIKNAATAHRLDATADSDNAPA